MSAFVKCPACRAVNLRWVARETGCWECGVALHTEHTSMAALWKSAAKKTRASAEISGGIATTARKDAESFAAALRFLLTVTDDKTLLPIQIEHRIATARRVLARADRLYPAVEEV